MNTSELTIRNLTRQELDIAVSWATKEGWNPGLHDAEVFYNTDPKGFFGGFLNGELIASLSGVTYGSEFGFLGFYIVREGFRGNGYGLKLWNQVLGQLKVKCLGLDGVFAQQNNYAKSGFKFSHRDLRFEAVAKKENYSQNVTEIIDDDFDKINAFDKKYFGFDRTKFFNGWLKLPESKALKFTDGSNLKGYSVIRKCQKGFKIGPLFATDYQAAHELFKGLSSYATGELVYLDVPEINKDGMKLATTYNMKECFGCARMYFGQVPKLPYNQIFGVTTFELG